MHLNTELKGLWWKCQSSKGKVLKNIKLEFSSEKPIYWLVMLQLLNFLPTYLLNNVIISSNIIVHRYMNHSHSASVKPIKKKCEKN